MSGRQPRRGSITLGVMRLGRGRADGLQQFRATPEAFLASLAPLVAFPLVGSVLMLLDGGGLDAIEAFLATICALLAPLVLTYEVARLWHRQATWLRFATAFNWCQWLIPVVGGTILFALGVMVGLGLPRQLARVGFVLGVIAYGLWLHIFLARHGLGLTLSRAVAMVLGVNCATVVLVLGPRMLALAAGGSALVDR
ncbi:MAG TPA: hypothetical protein VFL55_12085 [Acetobacteraceae bacterium]|nr:hypothetical protein [Acetobacteraceae bacterium]